MKDYFKNRNWCTVVVSFYSSLAHPILKPCSYTLRPLLSVHYHLLLSPLDPLLLISLQKRAGLLPIPLNVASQGAIRDTSLHIKAGQGNPEGKGSQKEAEESDTPPGPLLGGPQNPKSTQGQHVCRAPSTDPCRLRDCCFSLVQ